MKKKTILKGAQFAVLGLFVCQSMFAQHKASDANRADAPLGQDEAQINPTNNSYSAVNKGKSSSAVVWSEDFGGGFANSPNGAWTVSGANSQFVEYDMDGPDNLIQFGWGPLPSPTAGNGFAIFDWYDNIPDLDPNVFASAPAQGILTSPTINLGSNTDVYISFYQQLFWCCEIGMDIWMEISTDGGTTWPHQYKVNVSDRNVRHWNVGYGYYFEYNISDAVVNNPSNVKIRFNWTSLSPDQNGQYSNAYFWMLDDLQIQTLPNNSLKFTDLPNDPATTADESAPATDIVYTNAPRRGHIKEIDVSPISFDANIFNFGVKDQTDVQLVVDVYKDGSLFTTVSSTPIPVLASGDTATFNDLFTPTFTPNGKGEYEMVYKIVSDSIPARAGSIQPVDTPYVVQVTEDETSLDFGVISNTIGTPQLGNDGSALAVLLPFNAKPGQTEMRVENLEVYLSTATVAGGDLQVEIYDTAGFDYTTGFGSQQKVSASFTIGAGDPGTLKTLDLSSYNVKLPVPGAYYVVVYMFSNAGANLIRIGNDGSVNQGAYSIMYDADDARWYSGYSNSNDMESPFIRVNSKTIGLDEENAVQFNVFPNPSNGDVKVRMETGGTYTVELVNLLGQTINSNEITVNGNEEVIMDYSSVATGVYIMNVSSDKGSRSVKLTIK